MPQQRMYYEYVDQQLIPYWYVLTFSPCELNWDKHVFYYDVIKPFEYIERGDFDESVISMSIHLSDLVFNHNLPEQIGINLYSIRKRIESYGVDPDVVRQLIIPTPELENFIELLPTVQKMSLVLK
ncbi:hypothetical protein V7127_02390 [Bacillus sp. JJ1773]|uniref:hypothetical protein n=1 Tax=Bacillus sp. JJ1773 TaxID=3122965 RepID=UPI002FFE0567